MASRSNSTKTGRVKLQQGFVHAAKFLGAEVLVVHLPQDVALHGEGQMPDGLQHAVVGQLALVQVGHGPVREQHRPQRGQAKARLALVEQLEDDLEALPEIAVPGSAPPLGQPSDAGERVVLLEALADGRVCVGRQQKVSILGYEQEDESIDQSE